MKRRIYLVRHGLTRCNTEGTIQDEHDTLTERGVEQAGILAARLADVPFDTLLCSDMERAQHTARVIAVRTGHEPQPNPLFRETQYPRSLVGKKREEPEVQAYYEARAQHLDDPHWRYEEEETFAELRARVRAALTHVEALESHATVVVTHGHFMRLMLLEVLLGDTVTPRQAHHTLIRALTNNTGITALEHRDGRWQLLTWNDHAHLG